MYDISTWASKHPGGKRVISHFAGEDASEAFHAFHPDLEKVNKYMKPLLRGPVRANEAAPSELLQDFRDLRDQAEQDVGRPTPLWWLAHTGNA